MPISSIDDCSSDHWKDVLGILKEACDSAGFIPNLVSDSDEIGTIHNRIVENIYSNDLIICDVSCKNANVMFELGMRLAFDKPTIIIKDDVTGYSFDTSVIEHLEYPRDLRFASIIEFKKNLGKKMKATFSKSISDPKYSPFLKHFGKYKIAHLDSKEISSENYILKAIEDIKQDIRVIKNQPRFEESSRKNLWKSLNKTNIPDRKLNIPTERQRRFMIEYVLPLLVDNPKKPSIGAKEKIIAEVAKLPEADFIFKSILELRRNIESFIDSHYLA